MDCNGCYVLKSRRFVGIADASFEDAADGIDEFGGTMSPAHEQKAKGVEGTMEMEEKQELSWKSSLLSSKDDDLLLPGSHKLQASISEGAALSGKMGFSESRTDRSGSNGTRKVPRLGSVLGTASVAGFGKAVEILDTLGCLMTTLSPDGGFISRSKNKGCKISILSFEVANTILKGASIMQSLSDDTVTYFKQVVLPSEGVQSLISRDMSELMRIAANDKREELKLFSQEIVRFGNRCKDPQWHNLDRYFFKSRLESESAPQKQLKETAIAEMQKLMTLVQHTTDLYHELHALDRFEQEYRSKLKGKENSVRFDKGDNMQIVRLELKTQRSYVKSLKKKSLWSKTLEEVVEKLVEIVHYLHNEINNSFGSSDLGAVESNVNCQRLGPAGLALHYANIIIQIYSIVSRSGYVPASTRDALYQGLPPRVRSALPNRLRSSLVPRELTIDQIRARMEKTLKWLVPMAINTTCARGFLRFSEWAKSGTERVGRRPGQPDAIETLHHANKERTEAHILELVIWLHHLVSQSNRPSNAKDQ